MKELNQRILIAAIFIPILLAVLYFGGAALIVLFALATLLCQREYIVMLRNVIINIRWYWLVLALSTYLGMVFLPDWDVVILWALFFVTAIEAVIRWDKVSSAPRAAFAMFGTIYTAILPALIVRLGQDQQDTKLLLWLVVMIWLADSSAYFIGSAWGKHRNIFTLSPNKSLEGFLAGALAPFIIMIILYYAGLFDSLAVSLLVAFAAGIVGQFGDLAESMLKRFCGVKDSSRLIPGHGGILDRMDSILLAGSFLYSALIILNKVR